MVVYANLAGKWIELGDDNFIENQPAEIYINENFMKSSSIPNNSFLKISHKDLVYNVHISQIQWATDRY